MTQRRKKDDKLVATTAKGKQQSIELDSLEQITAPPQAMETVTRLEAAVERADKAVTVDDYSPPKIAEKIEAAGVTKGKLNTLSTIILGILAGVFIGLGAVFYTLVTTNSGLGFGMAKLLGGLVFCLGLILVVVAGSELFTGNNLVVMSWLSGRTSFGQLMRNWGLVYFSNFAGAIALAGLMFATYQWAFSSYGVGANALLIANAKVNLTFGAALSRGILCNFLVCLAVWIALSARTTTGKIVAIIFPITAFVAMGFEHSIANMYFIPIGMFLSNQAPVLEAAGVTASGVANLNWMGFVGNLVPVTIGNIIGGAVLVAAVYWLTYLRKERAAEVVANRPWLAAIIRAPHPAKAEEPLTEIIRAQIEELIRANQEEPLALDRGSKVLLEVLRKANDDDSFLSRLAENPDQALKGYELTSEEKAALSSGDIRWIESKLGTLEEPLRSWLNARLAQEKW